jgi:hypothetical protein
MLTATNAWLLEVQIQDLGCQPPDVCGLRSKRVTCQQTKLKFILEDKGATKLTTRASNFTLVA